MPIKIITYLTPPLLLLIIGMVYLPVLQNDFVIRDTNAYIIENSHIKALNWENLQWMFTSFYKGNWTPLAWLSHALTYAIFGLNPWGHHLMDLLIHGLNTCLFFWLVLRLINWHRRQTGSPLNQSWWIASIAAFLFGIHPQHVESVAWVAERKGLLAAFFILLTLISYLTYFSAKQRLTWYFLTWLACLGALLSKPVAITLPALMLLLDIYPLQRTFPNHPHFTPLRRLLWEKLPFLILSSIVMALGILAQSNGNALSSYEQVDNLVRIFNAFANVWLYISKFLFPLSLSPIYSFPAFGDFTKHNVWLIFLPVLSFFLLTTCFSYLWYKKYYYWLIIWLYYLIALTPTSGFLQFGDAATADRFAYVPTLPFYLLVAVGSVKLFSWQRKSIQITSLIVFIGVSVVLSILTRQQISVWKNELTFWDYTVTNDPDNPIAQGGLANLFYLLEDYEKAAKHYEFAVITGGGDFYRLKLADTYLTLHQYEPALKVCREVIANHTLDGAKKALAYYMMGVIYDNQKEFLKAQEMLKNALKLNPHHQLSQELLRKITSSSP